VTEQLTFQKIERDRSAIKLYESAPTALTCIVNGMCDEFLSRSGFPFDENSRVCGRYLLHLLENSFKSSAIADDPLERTFGLIRLSVHDCCVISHRNLT
jgi:hypothetical protein